ncbi:unnamed protein product [marine sediment metagenome]|uniref:Uncharacterized protein n=1 Tax=marine sediment metagenome TaxID=412755 RepID=X1INY9_9ZZZZ
MINFTNKKNSDNEEDEFYNKLKEKKRSFEIKRLPKEKLDEIEKSVGGLKLTEDDLKHIENTKKKKEEE